MKDSFDVILQYYLDHLDGTQDYILSVQLKPEILFYIRCLCEPEFILLVTSFQNFMHSTSLKY